MILLTEVSVIEIKLKLIYIKNFFELYINIHVSYRDTEVITAYNANDKQFACAKIYTSIIENNFFFFFVRGCRMNRVRLSERKIDYNGSNVHAHQCKSGEE